MKTKRFRGKCKRGYDYSDGSGWVYGSLLTNGVESAIVREHDIDLSPGTDDGIQIIDDFGCIPVETDSVGQDIGLGDKNNQPIYEGDIVEMHQFLFDGTEHENTLTGVISSGEYGWMLTQIKNKEVNDHMGYEDGEGEAYLFDFHGLHEESFEVIGNIYGN